MFQLRYLQTLNSISAENNSTVIFPVPIDIMNQLMNGNNRQPQYPVYLPQQHQQFMQQQVRVNGKQIILNRDIYSMSQITLYYKALPVLKGNFF